MRVQQSLLWLLLPAIATSLSAADQDVGEDTAVGARHGLPVPKVQAIETSTSIKGATATVKPDVGTKDAPVDGLDGKPHAGPWVGLEGDSTRKKQKPQVEDLGKSIPTNLARLEKEYSSGQGWQLIPEKNDGVMDDSARVAPKEGTRGTEGGVSEKSKKAKAEELKTGGRKPKTPKEPPPLPHSEQELIKNSPDPKALKDVKGGDAATTTTDKPKGAQGLEKPTDLPQAPKDKTSAGHKSGSEKKGPDPYTASSGSKLLDTMPYTEGTKAKVAEALSEEPEGIIQPLHSFVLALAMILVSEIGDKTFLIAALMAMRHDRIIVFTAAFSALIAMTVLSAVLGHAVPTLLPRRFVAFAAAILFLVFGAKMLREGLAMPKDSGVGEEMEEVEAELAEKEELARKNGGRRRSDISSFALEAGRGRRSGGGLAAPARSPSTDSDRSPSPSRRKTFSSALGGLNNLFSLVLSPAWVQTFVMTFLGEWGDRSQIATIAMAAGQDYWWVTGGAVTGHMFCTGLAVIGGRALAGRVSMRVGKSFYLCIELVSHRLIQAVTIGGAVAFLVFGVIYLLEAIYSESTSA